MKGYTLIDNRAGSGVSDDFGPGGDALIGRVTPVGAKAWLTNGSISATGRARLRGTGSVGRYMRLVTDWHTPDVEFSVTEFGNARSTVRVGLGGIGASSGGNYLSPRMAQFEFGVGDDGLDDWTKGRLTIRDQAGDMIWTDGRPINIGGGGLWVHTDDGSPTGIPPLVTPYTALFNIPGRSVIDGVANSVQQALRVTATGGDLQISVDDVIVFDGPVADSGAGTQVVWQDMYPWGPVDYDVISIYESLDPVLEWVPDYPGDVGGAIGAWHEDEVDIGVGGGSVEFSMVPDPVTISIQVWVNGLLLRRDVDWDYADSDPGAATVTVPDLLEGDYVVLRWQEEV